MKKRSISDIAQKGGFPQAIDEVVRTNRPLIVTVRGKSAVTISPCSPLVEDALTDTATFGQVLSMLSAAGLDDDFDEHLIRHFMLGIMAQSVLMSRNQELAQTVFQAGERMLERLRRLPLLFSESNSITMQRFAHIMKNSSEESGSVPPMTTARADVSTTKQQEGLDFANPSLPRKRGRPRKTENSSLPKRKIGTKREKPAS